MPAPSNSPYLQGYYDCKEGKTFNPHYVFELKDHKQVIFDLSNYERGQYTLGWDTAIKGDAA
jgi:hypothetical protein